MTVNKLNMIGKIVGNLFEKSKGSLPVRLKLRNLSLHEYASLKLLRDANVRVIDGSMFRSSAEAYEYAKHSQFKDFVVKAQVLAGGRGKGKFSNGFAGGVHIAWNPEDVKHIASKMIGSQLITKQTGEKGLPCNMVFVCERVYPRREYYIAFALDRSSDGPILIASNRGGVNIEETAREDPDAVIRQPIDILTGLSKVTTQKVLRCIGFNPELIDSATEEIMKLYNVFISRDMLLLEINPFCETNDGRVLCMDCKVQVDDNALFRQPKVTELRDLSQENELDVLASQHNINYIKLNGNVGCLVNGAGLAMATMDILNLYGGSPANFLDIGGSAAVPQIVAAFDILTKDPNVKVILVNIFGGIMRCDIVAEGIVEAKQVLKLGVPIIVRLHGTNSKDGVALLKKHPDNLLFVDDFDQASQLAVQISKIVSIVDESNLKVSFKIPASSY